MEANNAAAMREAMIAMLDDKCKQCYINDQICTQGLKCHWNGKRGEICQDEAMDKAIAALAAPPRNCDVGTAEEQIKRHKKWCDGNICMFTHSCRVCFAKWAQTPCEEGGAGGGE